MKKQNKQYPQSSDEKNRLAVLSKVTEQKRFFKQKTIIQHNNYTYCTSNNHQRGFIYFFRKLQDL